VTGTVEVVLASGNPAKAALLQDSLARAVSGRVTVRAVDPGDAELHADPGYEAAALAKARAVAALGHPVVLGHDSGYEFACLDGAPGPLTARTLAAHGLPWLTARLRAGTEVRVVHSVTLSTPAGVVHATRSDLRTVPRDGGAGAPASLPLTAWTTGPATALGRALHDVFTRGLPALVDHEPPIDAGEDVTA
jgi:hypothetical protein